MCGPLNPLSEFRNQFFIEVNHTIDLKAENMTSSTNFNRKAVEVTEIEKKQWSPESSIETTN